MNIRSEPNLPRDNLHRCVGAARPPEAGSPGDWTTEPIRSQVIEALRRVQDPELPVNIFDLGLIYELQISDEGDVDVRMTLTAPGCPVAGIMPVMVKNAILEVDGIGLVNVELTWEPPWTVERMTDEARLACNL